MNDGSYYNIAMWENPYIVMLPPFVPCQSRDFPDQLCFNSYHQSYILFQWNPTLTTSLLNKIIVIRHNVEGLRVYKFHRLQIVPV